MPVALVDRDPTAQELEKLRLLLSTYQDGTGMLALRGGRTLPGWRDFERSVALVFNGEAQESKAVFDILLSNPAKPSIRYGLSCKMRETLDDTTRTGRVTIELSNSAREFWKHIEAKGIDRATLKKRAAEVGVALIERVQLWHNAAAIAHQIDLKGSSYLVLSWSKRQGLYQLHKFRLTLPDPKTLDWHWPRKRVRETEVEAERLVGVENGRTVYEWYGESGGQLKYYPLAQSATWISEPFRLETLQDANVGLLFKVQAQFPELWRQANLREDDSASDS